MVTVVIAFSLGNGRFGRRVSRGVGPGWVLDGGAGICEAMQVCCRHRWVRSPCHHTFPDHLLVRLMFCCLEKVSQVVHWEWSYVPLHIYTMYTYQALARSRRIYILCLLLCKKTWSALIIIRGRDFALGAPTVWNVLPSSLKFVENTAKCYCHLKGQGVTKLLMLSSCVSLCRPWDMSRFINAGSVWGIESLDKPWIWLDQIQGLEILEFYKVVFETSWI